MDMNILNRLQGSFKDPPALLKNGRKPLSGTFRISNFDPNWYWAVATISASDADYIRTVAKQSPILDGRHEAKFAAAMIEDYLRTHALGVQDDVDRAVKECKSHGCKFLPGKTKSSNVWLQVGLSERLARATRNLLKNRPGEILLTDYQLMSEILRLATVDLRADSDSQPCEPCAIEQSTPVPLEVVPMTHPEDVSMTPLESPNSTDLLVQSVEIETEATLADQPEPVNEAASKRTSKFPSFVVKATEALKETEEKRKKLSDL